MNKLKKILLYMAAASVAVLIVFVIAGALLRDTTAPVITCPEGVLKAKAGISEEALLKGVTAVDNKDGDVSGAVVVESLSTIGKDNTREITYAVMDLSGNVGRATRTLKYTNYRQPRIRLDQPLRTGSQQGVLAVLDTIRASSPLDGDLSNRVKYSFPNGGYVNGEGEYQVVLRVSDSAGASTVINTMLEVYNGKEETIRIDLKDYLVYLDRGDDFDPMDYYEIASQSGRLIVDSDVDTSAPGVYHVRYRVQADSGEYGQTTLVVVVEA